MRTQISVPFKMFEKDNPHNVSNCINDAEAMAEECVAHSQFIKSKHEEGKKNTSQTSTVDGALKSAEIIIGSIDKKTLLKINK